MTKQRRYAVAIDATGAVIKVEPMPKCPEGTPETWHPDTVSWANVWAESEQEAKTKSVAMWRRAALLALAEAGATLLLLTDNSWRDAIPGGADRVAVLLFSCATLLPRVAALSPGQLGLPLGHSPAWLPPPGQCLPADDPSGRWRQAQEWVGGNTRAARLAAVGALGAELAALAAACWLHSIYQTAYFRWVDDREEQSERARDLLTRTMVQSYAGGWVQCMHAAAGRRASRQTCAEQPAAPLSLRRGCRRQRQQLVGAAAPEVWSGGQRPGGHHRGGQADSGPAGRHPLSAAAAAPQHVSALPPACLPACLLGRCIAFNVSRIQDALPCPWGCSMLVNQQQLLL
jgi:hypothetical protein